MKFAAAILLLAGPTSGFSLSLSSHVPSKVRRTLSFPLRSTTEDDPTVANQFNGYGGHSQTQPRRIRKQSLADKIVAASHLHHDDQPLVSKILSQAIINGQVNGSGNAELIVNAAPEGDYLRHERISLDITKTVYVSSVKSPEDAYIAFADKGAANAKMSKTKILHQSVMGGMYVGFAGLLAMQIAGNLGAASPGVVKMTFGALFPVNLLLILATGGQLFTGNSSTVAAAKFEGLVTWRELWRSWGVSMLGNVIGCGLFALAASYTGLLSGGAGEFAVKATMGKVSAGFGQTLVKGILCNWMVSLALFLAGASNNLSGKMVGIWFPISTFVGIGLEHSVANLFILPAGLLAGASVSMSSIFFKNLIPVIIGNAIAGAAVVAASYSYQFGKLGAAKRKAFRARLKLYEERKAIEKNIRGIFRARRKSYEQSSAAGARP